MTSDTKPDRPASTTPQTFKEWWKATLDAQFHASATQYPSAREAAQEGWNGCAAAMQEKMECGHPKLCLNVYGFGKPTSRSDVYCAACYELDAAYQRGFDEANRKAELRVARAVLAEAEWFTSEILCPSEMMQRVVDNRARLESLEVKTNEEEN